MFEIGVENTSIAITLAVKYFGPLAAALAGVYGIVQTILVLGMIKCLKAKDNQRDAGVAAVLMGKAKAGN